MSKYDDNEDVKDVKEEISNNENNEEVVVRKNTVVDDQPYVEDSNNDVVLEKEKIEDTNDYSNDDEINRFDKNDVDQQNNDTYENVEYNHHVDREDVKDDVIKEEITKSRSDVVNEETEYISKKIKSDSKNKLSFNIRLIITLFFAVLVISSVLYIFFEVFGEVPTTTSEDEVAISLKI